MQETSLFLMDPSNFYSGLADVAQEKMQKYFPGDYIIDWVYSPNLSKFRLEPVFTDLKKEMLWKLKYGY